MASPRKKPWPCKNCGQEVDRYQYADGTWAQPRYCGQCRAEFRHPGGKTHWHWRGGERSSKQGYLRVYVGPGKRSLEHRVVWEAANGPIPRGMHVHHKNGDKTDNRIENLELLSNSEHQAEHRPERTIRATLWSRKHRQCVACGTTERAHQARGLCKRCYLGFWYELHLMGLLPYASNR